MAKPKAIVVWFDDGTSYQIDPSAIRSIFVNEKAAAKAGRPGPHQLPGSHGPIQGPFSNNDAPTLDSATTAADTAEGGTCFYVNGIIVCP